MPHPSPTDLYSTLDPCAINHHQGEEKREKGMERPRGKTKRRGQMGGGTVAKRQETRVMERGREGGGAVCCLRAGGVEWEEEMRVSY